MDFFLNKRQEIVILIKKMINLSHSFKRVGLNKLYTVNFGKYIIY